jgi:hypothetical protein
MKLPHIFQTWGGDDGKGYSTSLGHTLNWWHFRRTDKILEQVYLSGMMGPEMNQKDLINLERSWITFPRLIMEELPDPYIVQTYSQEQKAYIIPLDHEKIDFELGFENEEDNEPFSVSIVNPVFVLKGWGSKKVEVKMNGKILEPGNDLRIGYENHPGGTDLILWIKVHSSQAAKLSIEPAEN